MYAARPGLMDIVLPDGSAIEGRAYREADDGVVARDARRFLLPIRSVTRSQWPGRVVGVTGLRMRREGRPGTVPITARWATPVEVDSLWPIARRALPFLPVQPAEGAGIVVIDISVP